MSEEEYYAGCDGDEIYNCHDKNKEVAILECIKYHDMEVGQEVQVGKIDDFKPHNIDVDYILEDQQEMAFDECGECSEDWLTSIDEDNVSDLKKRITDVYKQWLDDIGETPRFGLIAVEETIKVTQEHLDDLK